jgi:hypothetical protein
MATNQSPEEPARKTVRRPSMPKVLKRLTSGFDRLTLDPSARLRATRQRLENYDPIQEAWEDVGQAMNEAIQSVSSPGQPKSNP